MKQKKTIRPGYLFAIPLVLVIVILYSGVLQLILPAVSVNGTDYRVSEFNYYYFSTYNELVEDELWLLQSGFQPNLEESDQIYQDGVTWRDHFVTLAEERLARVAYYYDRGQAEDYTDDEVSRLVAARQSEIEGFCALNGISADNYYKAYYGSGMTAKRYLEHYEKEMYAQQYQAYLIAQRPVSEEAILEYCAQNDLGDDLAANVYLLAMAAPADRYTGQVGEEQLEQHRQKLAELEARYSSGRYSFQELYDAFSDWKTESGTGFYENATHYDLPGVIDKWLYEENPQPGDFIAVLSPEDGMAYLAVFSDWGTPGARIEAVRVLRYRTTAEEEHAALSGAYQVAEHSLGLRFAAT